jgi:ABC-type antimicrobial peptide transport system permease subunit
MDALSLFGLFAVTAMLVAYALEDRSHWYILAFAGACALGSVWIHAGRLAVRAGRGDLGRRRVAALVCQAAITSPLLFRQDAKPCRALY